MSFNHPVSDLVSRIRNSYSVHKKNTVSPFSKSREVILRKLKELGYITNYSILNDGSEKTILINLKYISSLAAVSEICVVSKPGRRIYYSKKRLGFVNNGLGVMLISTSLGIMTDHEAEKQGVGGEVLLKVF